MARRGEQKILSADVEPAVALQVRRIAKANRTSVSAIVRQAIELWLRGGG